MKIEEYPNVIFFSFKEKRKRNKNKKIQAKTWNTFLLDLKKKLSKVYLRQIILIFLLFFGILRFN